MNKTFDFSLSVDDPIFNAMTDDEFLSYVDKFCDNAIVRRLVKLIDSPFSEEVQAMMDDLYDLGMDKDTLEFDDGRSVGDYIRNLENELELVGDECSELNQKLEQAIERLDIWNAISKPY